MKLVLFNRIFASAAVGFLIAVAWPAPARAEAPDQVRVYANRLTPIRNAKPLLADHPEFVAPVVEKARFEAPVLVDDEGADLDVRAWRFSYNARGIIEIPNRLRADRTALIVVHPWGVDDGQGWRTPEPAGVCDFCTPDKNHYSHEHIKKVLNPFIHSLRGKTALVMFSQPGKADPIRTKLYRTFTTNPSDAERKEAAKALHEKLNGFKYIAEPLPAELTLSRDRAVIDYFKQFPGLDPGPRYNGAGYWDLPIPVVKSIDVAPDDVMIFDAEGYDALKKYLQESNVRHILLAGYCTDMCYAKTTAGFENLSKDFNVFLVGDATLATFPANSTPAHATNAAISFASLNQLITQISWIEYRGGK